MNNMATNDPNEKLDSDEYLAAAQPKQDNQGSQSGSDALIKEGAGDEMEDLMVMYEESFQRFAEGEVVTGRVISIDKDFVLVDIGYKSEGQIRIHEFMDENGEMTAKLGDVVEVMVEWWDDDEEVVVLSKEKAAKIKVWEEIKNAYDEDGIVEGVIVHRVKPTDSQS